jgi:hypothetical protein
MIRVSYNYEVLSKYSKNKFKEYYMKHLKGKVNKSYTVLYNEIKKKAGS